MQRDAYRNRSPHLQHHINMTVNLISIAMFYTTQLVGDTSHRHPVNLLCNQLVKKMKPMLTYAVEPTENERHTGKDNWEVRLFVREMAKMRRTLRGTCDVFDIPYKSVSVQSFANRVKPFEIWSKNYQYSPRITPIPPPFSPRRDWGSFHTKQRSSIPYGCNFGNYPNEHTSAYVVC